MKRRIPQRVTETKCFLHGADIYTVEDNLNEFFYKKTQLPGFVLISIQTFLNRDRYATIVVYSNLIRAKSDDGWRMDEDGQMIKEL